MADAKRVSITLGEREDNLDAARAAKAKLIPLLKKHVPDAAVGLTRDGDRFGLKVNLSHPPRDGFEIPKAVDGVKIRAELVGAILKR